MNKYQESYSVTEKECLAIVWAIDKFRHYLLGSEFTVKTDHCGLCWLMRISDPSGKLCRWAIRLSEYKFNIMYKNGKSHGNVDTLSRYPLNSKADDCDEIPIYVVEEVNVMEEQINDGWCKYIKKRLEEKKLKPNEVYEITDGILWRKIFDSRGIERKLMCHPKSLRKEVMITLHNDPTSGHLGFIRTLYRIKERFYFPRIEKAVRRYVRSCQDCQSRKHDSGQPKGDLQQIKAEEPFAVVGMDIFGPLPTTSVTKKRYVILLIDYFTKWVEAVALKEMKSEDVADFFINPVVLRHGAVKRCITDRAQNFCSKFTEAIFEAFAIKHVRTSGYHPQTNGLAERQCRTLTDMIALYTNDNQKDWDKFLPFLVFAYNTARHDTTKTSPFYLVYGREPRLPIDVTMNLPSAFDITDDIQTRFEEARGIIRQSVIDARRRQKYAYDKSHRKLELMIGQKVLVYTKIRKIGLNEKLLNSYHGPFVLVKKLTPVTYLAEDLRTKKRTRAHINRIKIFYDDDLDKLEDNDIWNLEERETLLKREYKISNEEIERRFKEDVETASIRSVLDEETETASDQNYTHEIVRKDEQ